MSEFLIMIGLVFVAWGGLRMLLGLTEEKNVERVQEAHPNMDVEKYKKLDNQSKIGIGLVTTVAGLINLRIGSQTVQMTVLIAAEVIGVGVYYWYRKKILAGE